MPYKTVHNTPDKTGISLEYEFVTLTVRIYDGEKRIASFTVTSTGATTARITDLTLVHPHKFTRELMKVIRSWLVRMGYSQVSYERQIKKHHFVIKEYKL